MRMLIWVLIGCGSSLPVPEGVAGEEGRLHFLHCDGYLLGSCGGESQPIRRGLMPATRETVRIEEHLALPPLLAIGSDSRVCSTESLIGPCCVEHHDYGCDVGFATITSFTLPSCEPTEYGPVDRVFVVHAMATGSCELQLRTKSGVYEQLAFHVEEPASLQILSRRVPGEEAAVRAEERLPLSSVTDLTVQALPLDDQGQPLTASDEFQFAVEDPTVAGLLPIHLPNYFDVVSPLAVGTTTLVMTRPPLEARLPITVY